ncbi:hypothetical protein PV433_30955 [Paenibacillus sp. GYB004]|uniref:hypothetical protein n=1 Tax=Paenibacillus sp. GYB004 TaxID=2994393 RepID=UPI002F968960
MGKQMLMFPEVTEEDKITTKLLLQDYKQLKKNLQSMEKEEYKTLKQQETIDGLRHTTTVLEMAVRAISEDEVREVTDFRFLNPIGQARNLTIIEFQKKMSESTIDRRIAEGIKEIAENLKLWGEIGSNSDGGQKVNGS